MGAGEGSVEDEKGLSGDGLVSEDEAASVGSDTMLEVPPVTQRVHRLILADLGSRVKAEVL